jgi:hypothetical protein
LTTAVVIDFTAPLTDDAALTAPGSEGDPLMGPRINGICGLVARAVGGCGAAGPGCLGALTSFMSAMAVAAGSFADDSVSGVAGLTVAVWLAEWGAGPPTPNVFVLGDVPNARPSPTS